MTNLIGKPALDFTTSAVLSTGEIINNFNFLQQIKDKYALLFFYPLDFTFVCPSELIALDHRMPEFNQRGINVIAASIDSPFTHFAWRNTPVNNGGIGAVKYTLISDITHRICQAYGVEHLTEGVALRAAFVIDKKGIVRATIIHDLPIGRNVDEILRVFDAIEFTEQHGEVCPAGWKKGDKGMKADSESVASYLAEKGQEL